MDPKIHLNPAALYEAKLDTLFVKSREITLKVRWIYHSFKVVSTISIQGPLSMMLSSISLDLEAGYNLSEKSISYILPSLIVLTKGPLKST